MKAVLRAGNGVGQDGGQPAKSHDFHDHAERGGLDRNRRPDAVLQTVHIDVLAQRVTGAEQYQRFLLQRMLAQRAVLPGQWVVLADREADRFDEQDVAVDFVRGLFGRQCAAEGDADVDAVFG